MPSAKPSYGVDIKTTNVIARVKTSFADTMKANCPSCGDFCTRCKASVYEGCKWDGTGKRPLQTNDETYAGIEC